MGIDEELDKIAKRIGLEGLSESYTFPKYFEIETIRACNAKCEMCPVWKYPKNYGKMEKRLFEKISTEMSKYSSWINSVCLSRNGEPLLDKSLSEKIKTLKDYGIKDVTFSTNASLLDKDKSIELIESGLDDIRFSIDGATKETFESIRNGLNFEKVTENCLQFIKLRNERGHKPRIRIRMALQSANKHEEKEWSEHWKERVLSTDIVYSKPMHSWGNQLKSYESLLDKNTEIKKYYSIPCVSLWSTMIVHFDGKVPLCGVDYNNSFLMGDITSSTIKDVWNSKNFEEIRKKHVSLERYKINLCRGCNIWDLEEKRVYNPEGE